MHSSLQVFNSKVGAPNIATRQAVEYFLDAYKKTLAPGPLQLPKLSNQYELEDIAMDVFPTDHFRDFEKVRQQGKDFLSGALTALTPYIVGDGSAGVSETQLKETIEKSMVELEGGVYLRSEMQFIVRRKTKETTVT